MEDIIKELLRIESEANTRIMDATKEMISLDEQMKNKEAEIRINIDKQTDELIEKIREDMRRETSERIDNIKQRSDSVITGMEEIYIRNNSRWVTDIVNQVVGQ